MSFLICFFRLKSKIVPDQFSIGAINVSYEVMRGSLQDLSKMEGELAEPGQDFVAGAGSVILQDGQTSAAIPVAILEVMKKSFSHQHVMKGGAFFCSCSPFDVSGVFTCHLKPFISF